MPKPSLFVCIASLGALTLSARVEALRQEAPRALVDRRIDAHRPQMLERAFAAAAAVPVQPHAKTRARLLESVALASLGLGQEQRAAAVIEAIDDWRKGAALADLAAALVEHGWSAGDVEPYLLRARDVMSGWGGDRAQDWHHERIRAGLARVSLRLGDRVSAQELGATLSPSEVGPLIELRAGELDRDAARARLALTEDVVRTGNFDLVRNELTLLACIFERHYDDSELRRACLTKIEASWSKLPIAVRLELLFRTAESAIERGDAPQVAELTTKARALIDAVQWTPDFDVPFSARTAALRFRGGARAEGRAELDAALDRYSSRQAEILDIDRCDVLLAVAEAYAAIGDGAAASSVYRVALEAATVNPNSRPRAEDLCALCCSMAAHASGAPADLVQAIDAALAKLANPW